MARFQMPKHSDREKSQGNDDLLKKFQNSFEVSQNTFLADRSFVNGN